MSSRASNFSTFNGSRRLNMQYYPSISDYFKEQKVDADKLTKEEKRALQDLLADFRDLLQDLHEQNSKSSKSGNKLYDVEFTKSGEERRLYAQRQILTARSAIFDQIFKQLDDTNTIDPALKLTTTSDKNDDVIVLEIPDDFGLEIEHIEKVLHYIYWGYIDEKELTDEPLVQRLFVFASHLDLKELRRYLADSLFGFINPDRAVKYLELAHECSCRHLRKRVVEFIVNNKSEILNTPEWNAFSEKHIDGAKEVFKAIVDARTKK